MSKKTNKKSYRTKKRPGFAWDMPEDCKMCYFWNKEKSSCSLGGFDNCYYRISPPEKKQIHAKDVLMGNIVPALVIVQSTLTVICLS